MAGKSKKKSGSASKAGMKSASKGRTPSVSKLQDSSNKGRATSVNKAQGPKNRGKSNSVNKAQIFDNKGKMHNSSDRSKALSEKIKSKKNIFVRFFLILLCLLLVSPFLINLLVIASTNSRIISQEEASTLNANCILVLGAGVWGDRPSPMLQDRLNQGVSLYNLLASDRLLMSGDHGDLYYDEVNVMKSYAIDKGLPSEHIFMDHAGFSTYDSIYRARDIFQAKSVIIVTQKYHLHRALYLARSLGLDAHGVASNPRAYSGQSSRDVREFLARVKDFASSIFKPMPRFAGDPIPISGNGDVTNDK